MLRKVAPFTTDLWVHRELLWQFTLRNVELRHKGSHLGLIWSFLNPLLMLMLYVVVFGFIFGSRFAEQDGASRVVFGLGIFVGLTVFHLVAETIGTAPHLIAGNPNFVKKVVFPLAILPAATVGASLFHLLTTLVLVMISVAVWGTGISITWLWVPVILIPVCMLCLGIAWFFSALGVFLRDLGHVTQFLSMTLMFGSAIFYSAADIPPGIWHYMRFNPLIHAVELSRGALLWHHAPATLPLVYLYVVGALAMALGYLVFRNLRKAFADVL